MLRFVVEGIAIFLVIYGIIKLYELLTGIKPKKEEKAPTVLDELHDKAKKVAQDKEDILTETKSTSKKIDDINNTLN